MSDNGCDVGSISGEILILKILYFAQTSAGHGLSECEDCRYCQPSINDN